MSQCGFLVIINPNSSYAWKYLEEKIEIMIVKIQFSGFQINGFVASWLTCIGKALYNSF